MLAQLVNQTAGVGLGIFVGTLIGFGFRARSGNTDGLFQGSVFKTAVLAGMVAWVVAIVIAAVMGG